VVLENC